MDIDVEALRAAKRFLEKHDAESVKGYPERFPRQMLASPVTSGAYLPAFGRYEGQTATAIDGRHYRVGHRGWRRLAHG